MTKRFVQLTIVVTLTDTTVQPPSARLDPFFNITAGLSAATPGTEPFNCSGPGDVNEDLLKDILRKIITSYPMNPISLCVSGSEIVADAQCVGEGANTVVGAKFDIASTTLIRFVVEFSKPMPNGSGTMAAMINDKLYNFQLMIYNGPATPDPNLKPEDVPVSPGKNATRFLVVYDPAKIPVTKEEFPAALANQSVKVDLHF